MCHNNILWSGKEWDFEKLESTWSVIKDIALNKYGLTFYDTTFEIISAKQMIQNYTTHGLPVHYCSWEQGKHFNQQWAEYLKGKLGLAYEIVINTDPCIAYLMDSNDMPMQALVMAHSVCGHGSMFKNNYLFKNNTEANYILEYMGFADRFIKKCEKLYGEFAVMTVLDVAHMLQDHSYQPKRNKPPKVDIDEQRKIWNKYEEATRDELDKITTKHDDLMADIKNHLRHLSRKQIKLPEYDILYFIEKNIELADWKKEILRIVRIVSSYFYPQVLCKLLHEGWASYVHYTLCTEMWNQGYIDNESYMSIKHSHTQVANERRGWKDSLNPYYLGFAIFKDIERMCKDPTAEDKEYFPNIAGKGDKYFDICREIAYNNSDESFIRQYLSPALLRKLKIAVIEDDSGKYEYLCVGSHQKEYYRQTINHIADRYQLIDHIPQLLIDKVDKTNKEIYLNYLDYKDRGVVDEDRIHIIMCLNKLTKWTWKWSGTHKQ